MVAVREKIDDFLSRIAELKVLFMTPTADAQEQGRRDKLLRYVIVSLLD